MAAHKYWRLFISAKGQGQYVLISELVLATSASGPQAAVGGIATGTGQNPSNAFDGINVQSNYWLSTYMPGILCADYIQYEMPAGQEIDVSEIRITTSAQVGGDQYPSSFILLHSDDGKSWEIQKSWSNQVFVGNETKVFDTTPLPSSEVINKLVLQKTLRRNDAANIGVPNTGRALHLPMVMADPGGNSPAMTSPYTGGFYIAGSTTVLGNPAARRVNLIDQKSGLLVKSLVTGEDGVFLFKYIGRGPWTLLGIDPAAEQNSVVYAHVNPEKMT